MKLSCVIPSYKDPYLQPTIDSLLLNSGLGNDIEVIAVLDGYWPEVPLKEDPRVKIVHLGRNRGMRNAINAGVSVATGDYILRADEHNAFAPNYGAILIDSCEPNHIVTPLRYFLDPVNWAVMDKAPVGHSKLVIQNVSPGVQKFAGKPWKERDKELADVMYSETMAMQGSCWLMPHAWWDKVIGDLDSETYGPLYQDSHEMVFKTWKAGGKLMLNKNTWHAHKHRSFSRTHNNGTPENPSNNEQCWAKSIEIWRDYYEKEIAPKWGILGKN